jgi:hypothetical protein
MNDFTQRFASKIPWVMLRNDSGQSIPPYSAVLAVQWYFPNPSDPLSGNTLSPFFSALQPGQQNASLASTQQAADPYSVYITGREEIPPTTGYGPNGVAARPDTYPQLVSLDVPTDPNDGPYRTVGPTSGSQGVGQWTLTRDAPGFYLVGMPQANGYALVRTYDGPYRGNLPSNTANTLGWINVTTFIEPTGTPSAITWPVYNPFSNINTTQSGTNLRCTYDWVAGRWELLAAVPCSSSSGGSGSS